MRAQRSGRQGGFDGKRRRGGLVTRKRQGCVGACCGVTARCWRSRKATVLKEVVSGARSHEGGPPHRSWASKAGWPWVEIVSVPIPDTDENEDRLAGQQYS